MSLETKKERLLEENLCNHCLGRQFARLGNKLGNHERGAIIRNTSNLSKEDFKRQNIPKNISTFQDCHLCGGLFNHIEKYVNMVLDKVESYEFHTILIGTKVPDSIKEKEQYYRNKYGKQYSNYFKSEFNRIIGKKVQKARDASVDFKRPDIVAIINLKQNKIELQVNSLLIYGQYNKYSRELPQTILYCYNCHGKGCEKCDQTGLEYQQSVQQIIQSTLIDITRGEDGKFHGAGREDIDARCFGKREFVVEISNPLKRKINYKEAQEIINKKQSLVEVFNLNFTPKETIKQLKEKRADKTYRCLVSLDQSVDSLRLHQLEDLIGEINQRTPNRVLKNRADKTRKREIYAIHYEKIADYLLDIVVKAEAGTYIKELISGNKGRTSPSLSNLLDCKAECTKLDIIDIDK